MRNKSCWCGSGVKWKKCHYPKLPIIQHPQAQEYFKKYGILLKTKEQIAGIRAACQLTAFVLEETCKQAVAGVTTNELDRFAHRLMIEAGASPAPLGYGSPPYPKSICTSLNEVICHGIPDETELFEGDLLNIDASCILNGYYGDCSRMVAIGKLSEEKEHVMNVAEESLKRAIAILRPGVLICEIGETITSYANAKGCSVVNQFVGHGIGMEFHELPEVPHHRNQMLIPLASGMTFTIEPMINAGAHEAVIDPENHWTARTKDGRPSAQWEHTLLITEKGYEILTK